MRSPSAEKSEGLPSRKTSLPTTRKVTTIGVRLLGVFLAAGLPITKPKSDSVFTAITLVALIRTEVNALGHFAKKGTGLHLGANCLHLWMGVSNSWPLAGLARTP